MKNEKKNVWKSITVIAIVLSILAVAMVGAASAKSLYLIANHHTAQFDAWNIFPPPNCSVKYQFKVNLAHASWPADIAIDESSNVLFITSEGGTMVEMVNATTMALIGHIILPGVSTSNAGIEADDANDVVYVMRRGSPQLYAFNWNSSTQNLTLKAGFPKTLTAGGYGIALDETRGILWVADANAPGKARAYNTTIWTEITSLSKILCHQPVDIAVDRQRGQGGFVYTVSMTYGAGTPPGTGTNKLGIYDVANGTQNCVSLGAANHHGVGVAVDEVTHCVYITTQSPNNIEVWKVWNTTNATRKQASAVSGSPAGICVPQEEVGFNPLGLTKDDGLAPGACVNPGDTITYTMSYKNGNPRTVTGVTLVDTVPPEVTVTSTGGGTQSGNTVTWNIGTLTTGQSGSKTLTVTVNAGTAPGTTITNSATINANEPNTGPTTKSEHTDVCPNQPPNVSTAYPSIYCLWPPDHKFVDITILGVTDPDNDTVTINITGITSDEPTATIKGAGGAAHAPDASGVGTDTASVRAERSGKGNGRVYEITFVASDGIAETEGSVTVCVPHDRKKGTCVCTDDGQIYDATAIN